MPKLVELWNLHGPKPTTPEMAGHQKAVFAALGLDPDLDAASLMSFDQFKEAAADLERVMAESQQRQATPWVAAADLTRAVMASRKRSQQPGEYSPAAVWAQIRSTAK